MRLPKNRQNLVSIVLALLLALALPGTAFANKRDNGQDRDHDKHDKRDRKCGKFVNCHDARDGRRDGRGPRRDWDNDSGRHDRVRHRHGRVHHRHAGGHHPHQHDARELNPLNTVRFRRHRG